MEEFDAQLNNLNIQKVVDRVSTMGYPIDFDQPPPIMNAKKCLAENLSILNGFIDQKNDQSLEHFLADFTFTRIQTKKETGQFCFSLIYSLQIHYPEVIELFTILYLYCVDQCQNLSEFYLITRETILDYFSINDSKFLLDEVKVRLDDWISISSKLFADEPSTNIISKMTNLISLDLARKSKFDTTKTLTGARFQQILIKVYLDRRQKIFQQQEAQKKKNINAEQKKKEQNFDIFKGFYRWKTPMFGEEDFLKNPQNIDFLKKITEYRKKYPIMRKNIQSPQKKQSKSLTPVKQSPARRQVNQNLRKEIQRQLNNQNKYKLRFNLQMYYYQHVNNENINKFQLLEQKYQQLAIAEQKLKTETEEIFKKQLTDEIGWMKQDIEKYERELKNRSLLRNSLNDQLEAAGKVTFKEPHKTKTFQNDQSNCIFAYQVRNDDKFGNYMVTNFQATYFDTTIVNLPKPLEKDITYQQILQLFDETRSSQNFQPIYFYSITNFISKDERYLQLSQCNQLLLYKYIDDQLTAVAQLNDYIVGCNQKYQIGCFAPQYAQQS